MRPPRPRKDLREFKQTLLDLMGDALPPGAEDEIFREMLYNIGKLHGEKLDILELRLLNTAFAELRYALSMFKPYRGIPKAAVFGSARLKGDHPDFKIASEFGKKLAKKGWMIITGGAAGIMEAAMIGAGAKNSFGLNIMLPFEQSANPTILGNEKLVYFKYFFTRKLMFLKESEATVLFPGGFGTFDEGFESFTLVQTGKARPRPLVMVDRPGSEFWSDLLGLFKKHLVKGGLISPHDLTLMRHFQDADQAVEEVVGFYKNYESSRFLKDQYLIRLKRPLSEEGLRTLNTRFKDILAKGSFEPLDDPQEDDHADSSLYRIVFNFDRSSYARLRQLIDHLNTL
jgi:uncharacterized protein (TIGR00730 family)